MNIILFYYIRYFWSIYNHDIAQLFQSYIFSQLYRTPILAQLYKTLSKHIWVWFCPTIWDTFKVYMSILFNYIRYLQSIHEYNLVQSLQSYVFAQSYKILIFTQQYKIFSKQIWVYFCLAIQKTFKAYISIILPDHTEYLWNIHKYNFVPL